MTLDDLKAEAAVVANQIGINWDNLDDIKERHIFEQMVKRGHDMVPDLESLYTKLTSGKSVLNPDDDSPLSFDDVEKYTLLVSEELFNGYILQELHNKYRTIQSIIEADQKNPNGLDKGDNNQLDLFHD
jgi:hypothetical protein